MATAVSAACHALALVAVPRFGDGDAEARCGDRFVVAIVDRHPAGKGAVAGGESEDRPEAPAPAAAAAPPVKDRPRARQPPPRRARARTAASTPRSAPPAPRADARTPDVAREGAGNGEHAGHDSPVRVASRAAGGAAAPAAGPGPAAPAGEGRSTEVASRGSAVADGADLRPWCWTCPLPDYPARARREGWQGTVDVNLEVRRDGSVGGARVGRSSGFLALDTAAVAVARRSRFRLPVGQTGARGHLRYRFRLEDGGRR